jgi:curli biogenesis system outer membrane secretion channel CsgG
MFRLVATAAIVLLVPVASALAQTSCAAKAISREGKPLHGATRTSFMKRCCEQKAVGSDGKRLTGAAKASYMTKCLSDTSFPAPGRRG